MCDDYDIGPKVPFVSQRDIPCGNDVMKANSGCWYAAMLMINAYHEARIQRREYKTIDKAVKVKKESSGEAEQKVKKEMSAAAKQGLATALDVEQKKFNESGLPAGFKDKYFQPPPTSRPIENSKIPLNERPQSAVLAMTSRYEVDVEKKEYRKIAPKALAAEDYPGVVQLQQFESIRFELTKKDGGWTKSDLAKMLRVYGPLYVRAKIGNLSGHAIVLVGVMSKENSVIFHNPAGKPNEKMPIDKFNSVFKWDGDGAEYSLMFKRGKFPVAAAAAAEKGVGSSMTT